MVLSDYQELLNKSYSLVNEEQIERIVNIISTQKRIYVYGKGSSGFSKDGIHWEINHEPITFEGDSEVTKREYRYDPRVCFIEDRYYITWCNGYHGPTIGVAYTFDFKTFHQLENAFLPYNRNGVLFPRKINGNYMMLSRPSDTGHTPFGDIFWSLVALIWNTGDTTDM